MNITKLFFTLAIMLLFMGCTEIISEPNSSNSGFIIYGDPIDYVNERYQTIKIGEQIWFAKNLNYNVAGSKCYSNVPDYYCAKYGRLYNWATAMNLPQKCNNTLSTSDADCTINTPHQGLCPNGWYIPTNADWDKLIRFVEGNISTSSPHVGTTAGRYLRAQYGWWCYAGEDKYGFAALPSGFGKSDGSFYNASYEGSWWSTNENGSGVARVMSSFCSDSVHLNYNIQKSNLLSIRCFRNSESQ